MIDAVLFDDVDQALHIATHHKWVFRGQRQGNVLDAAPVELAHLLAARRGDEGRRAAGGDRCGNIDRRALDAAATGFQ